MPPALVIFDCDGVLVDSEPIANAVFVRHLNRAGFAFTLAEAYAELVGRSLPACLAWLERRFGRPLPPGFVAELERETFAAFRHDLRAVAGVAATVEVLCRAGAKVCVASSGSLDKMRLTLGLTGLWPLFGDQVFSADAVARGKPAPDLFLHAAAQFGIHPAAVAVVEDSAPGLEAGLAAGMRVVAYRGGVRPPPLPPGVLTVDNMADLPGLLGLHSGEKCRA
ncbi:MAG: HAD-IA family hydrolase [Alphaproteobacteria bacterium]|nr:HAD-IA family hydrolase [Alphaproteobacteria bacterium]